MQQNHMWDIKHSPYGLQQTIEVVEGMGIGDAPITSLCVECIGDEDIFDLLFHIDDAMLAHVEPQTVTDSIKFLDKDHGGHNHLTMTRGKLHECLGMNLDFRMKDSAIFA